MKKLIAIAAMSIASATALAGVDVIVRGDYINTPKFESRNVNSGTDVPGSSIFRGTLAKMNFDGKVGEASVHGRLDLGSLTTYAAGDVLVEYLVISKDFGNGLTMHAGKLEGMNGGWENAANTVGDVYLATLANGGIGGYIGALGVSGTLQQIAWTGLNGGTTPASEFTTPVTSAGNSRGLGLTYVMGDHKLDFQATNSTNHGTTSTYRRNNMGLYYTGSFADKMIMPMAGYMTGSSDTPAAGFEDTFMNVGAKMNFGMVGATVEYISNSIKASAAGGKADTVTSLYGLVDFTIDTWKPFLKFETSEFKDDDDAGLATSFKRTGLSVGTELLPKAGENFRYHIAYVSTSDKYGTAGSKETVSWGQLIAGLKYTADILK